MLNRNLLALASVCLAPGICWGQGSPPGCNGASSTAVLTIRVDDMPTPQSDCVQAGQDISYVLDLFTLPGPTPDLFPCNNIGGVLELTLPSGDVIALVGPQDLPEWGVPGVEITIGAYTANPDDADDHGFLTATMRYEAWTVLFDPPVFAADKVMEFTISICLITSSFCCDTNDDGVVDILDLLEVIMHWGEEGHKADVSGNGVVDILDIKCILLSWGKC